MDDGRIDRLAGQASAQPPARRRPPPDGDFARDWTQFRARFFARRDAALQIIRTHRTQYDYGDGRRVGGAGPDDGDRPVFACDVTAGTPVPTALPEVAWRAGLDLAPIDVTEDESVSRLESLVLRHDLPALAWTDPHGAWMQWVGGR